AQAGAEGLLAVLRPRRRRRGVVLPLAGARRRHAERRRGAPPDPGRGRIRFPRRFRARRVLGPAHPDRARLPVGRGFIARDACHSQPPYGSFGLNMGLEDAVNLAWKLSAALEGWGGAPLLASYELERRPIFVETGEAMIAGGIQADRAFLERYSPDRDRA